LAHLFKITVAERREVLPSGRQTRFDNRVAWAVVYLRKAGFLESPKRGRFRITEKGIKILMTKPPKINIKFLVEHGDPEFQEFYHPPPLTDPEDHNNGESITEIRTPREILEAGYQELRRDLSQELLKRIKSCSPLFFEQLVVDLLVKMGYGGSYKDAGQAVGKSGDGGIDGIIKEDKLGLDAIYIQAKRWDGTVGRPVVQAFAGSLMGHGARKGVLITTSQFSQDAKDYVTRIEKKIVLIDGEELSQLMMDYGIGVTDEASYTIKRLDSDYFNEEI
jgi:restriction system protein